ncbi:MAG: transcription-repair coupling factor [Oscillospiraceae bacterium]|nr:transcription-repair coupling factor [Oscillospiraceae bacterium]
MTPLLQALIDLPELRELAEAVDAGRCPAAVTGLSPVHRAMVAAALHRSMQRPVVMLCADETEARRMAGDLRTLCGTESALLFAREWQLRDRVYASHTLEQQRLGTLCSLAAGDAALLVATVDGVMQRTLPPSALRDAMLTLRPGERHDPHALALQLERSGYARTEQVEGVGQYALRGGILDLWSPLAAPVRVEFFDDEIDAMGEFDVTTQRRTKNIARLRVLPAAEVLPAAAEGGPDGLCRRIEHTAKQLARKKGTDRTVATLRADLERFTQGLRVGGMDRYLLACYPTSVTALDYLAPDALLLLSDGARCAERIKTFLWELEQDTLPLLQTGELAGPFAAVAPEREALTERLAAFPAVQLDALPTSRDLLPPRTLLGMNVRQLPSYGGSLETAAADMQHYAAARSGVLVLCGNETRAKNLLRLLDERGIRARADLNNTALPRLGEIVIGLGALSAGCELPQLRLAILTEGQLTTPGAGRKTRARQKKADTGRQRIQSYTDLSPGDLVVHAHHGIGRFVGIERIRVDGAEKDYIKIAYAGNDALYVPATQLDLVSKYIGGGGEDADGQPTARLNKLGGADWNRAKTRARAAAKDLAKGLIALYAERQRRPGYAFSPDSPWQREFEDAFDYAETDDQLRAVADIKADMERATPMDRLLCGDVGYGKTEVALRAVMKCILDGRQAAILVPTTVLAQQHYTTAMARFRSFPVRIEALSRFRSPAEKKKILQDTAAGQVDLLIGTHTLLQKNVKFRDLGLLIIDEEQRFGVTHKERLRELARQVDTLTLSATPIPRTLNMALSGLRDMSTIETPPDGRQPVQTYVLEHDWGIVCDAIRRELSRGGQVYYLHNRVETIARCAARLRELLGEDVGIAVAHGKLDERALSAVMQDMESGAVQVLVCSTIIETGIDIPNVNTLIIEDADRLGLAQLHQLRGRIGRSPRRAYAYMTYRPGKILTEVAAKRLSAIRAYAEFGSGFRIAMRDLEIRGAGNLLGPEQSGYMVSVGYDMYLALLEEAVLEERGVKKPRRSDTTADLTVSANLPESYIPSAEQRMDVYRRIAALQTQEESRDLLDELLDRYGEPPKSVLALMDVALLRTAAAEVGVRDVTQRGETVTFTFRGEGFPVEAVMRLCAAPKNRRRLTLSVSTEPKLQLRLARGEDVLAVSLDLVNELHLSRDEAQP